MVPNCAMLCTTLTLGQEQRVGERDAIHVVEELRSLRTVKEEILYMSLAAPYVRRTMR